MAGQQRRTLFLAVAGIGLAWLLALAGYEFSKNSRMTPERAMQHAHALDLSRLSAAQRTRALQKLADEINSLSPEERRLVRPDLGLFAQMTEPEREQFVDATMPMQVKQALAFFERLPDNQRQRIIESALTDLHNQTADDSSNASNSMPISPELESKIRTTGLKGYYSESPAETKAELAPLLNELQLQMQTNRSFRRGPN